GFDPALGAGSPARGGDDLAAFFDVIAAGHRLVYEPTAVVRHRHRADYDSLRRQAYSYGVGLSPYLAKTLVDHPGRVLDVSARAPRPATRSTPSFWRPACARSPRTASRPTICGWPRSSAWPAARGGPGPRRSRAPRARGWARCRAGSARSGAGTPGSGGWS